MSTELRDRLQAALGGTYTLERELGGGGMSRVFVATETALGRKVVVKVLPPEMAAGVNVDRFRREIQLAASLQHPHIVPLHMAGSAGDLFYYTMPLVEGESLRARLAREAELPVTDAVRILRDVVDALANAHAHGVVHRDIKPDNVLISGRHAVVTDFGVAKAISESTGQSSLTSAGLALGTPAYMAPEQAAGDPHVDHRADIYAVGALAYEMLTGRPPFVGASPQMVLAAHVTQSPEQLSARRPACPPALTALVMRCLEKKPADRWQSADELVRQLEAMATPSGGMAPTMAVRAAARRSPSRRAWLVGAGALVVLLVAAYLLQSRATARPADPAPSGTESIAVLPLTNVGGDARNEYFSDGMTDELATALGKIPGLRVASRTSSYAFKGKNVDVGQIGQALKVGTVLEGTVRRDGDRLRVSVQLTKVSDGLALWSDTYQRQATDVFQVQDDVARSVVAALSPTLGTQIKTAEVKSAAVRGTENLEAYDLYLRGQYLWHGRRADGLRQAAEYFKRAVALDPKFARASAWLALTYALYVDYAGMQPGDALPLVQQAADRALAHDTTLAETHTALGAAYQQVGRYGAADGEFRRAIRLDPRYPTAHQWYGYHLVGTGRVPEAIRELSAARDLDPLSPIISANLGAALAFAGRRDEALAASRRAVELAPSVAAMRMNYALTWEVLGEVDSAMAQLRESTRLETSSPTPLLGLAFRAFSHRRFAEAAEAADRAVANFPDNPLGYVFKAGVTLYSTGDQAGARRVVDQERRRIPQPPTDQLLAYPVLGGEYIARFEQLDLASVDAISLEDTVLFYRAKAVWANTRGRSGPARAYFDSLRITMDALPEAAPDFLRLPVRAIAYAGLGRRDDARRAIDDLLAFGRRMESRGERSTAGRMAYEAAISYMLVGDTDAAVQQLQRWLKLPTGGTTAYLRIDPYFTPLNGNPKFDRLVGPQVHP
jgi:serine/threonine-protein kinase